jgi:hypothetical protein
MTESSSAVASLANPGRGKLIDWTTQRWVQATGRRVDLADHPWLEGPVGDVDVIGTDFFRRLAGRRGFRVIESGRPRGLLDSFSALAGPQCRPAEVDPSVADFYEATSEYEFDVWSEWCGAFRPFGGLLASLFSRRLQQLNVPLSPLETKLGITSRVLQLVSDDGQVRYSAWVRETVATGRVLYVGSYSSCRVPGFEGPCVKVAFPLPNGYALVIMKPESRADGSFVIRSEGSRFGDPGFYFFVEAGPGRGWARYVASMKESISVFRDHTSTLRADHVLQLGGRVFLRLHYRMHRRGPTG